MMMIIIVIIIMIIIMSIIMIIVVVIIVVIIMIILALIVIPQTYLLGTSLYMYTLTSESRIPICPGFWFGVSGFKLKNFWQVHRPCCAVISFNILQCSDV